MGCNWHGGGPMPAEDVGACRVGTNGRGSVHSITLHTCRPHLALPAIEADKTTRDKDLNVRKWDGPAVLPPNPRAYSWGAIRRRNTPMPRKFDTAVVTIGIDPGKNILHLVGLDARGEIVPREKVARTKIVSRLANVPPVATLAVPSVENRRIVSSSSEVQPGWHL